MTINNDDKNDILLPSDSASEATSAHDSVTHLAHMPYSNKLEHKNTLAPILKRVT
ncbi:zinc finger CCCH domain-containing protein 24-like isoform X2 [Salvia divinorum]|uniref:Zinc finger CCCH domain-containing protein 24-like isoform X2 n=1 Tax=Salvia divinorum TaxID=28513 RepID=A0ABD1FNL3_SALDI